MIRAATLADFPAMHRLAAQMHAESNYASIPYSAERAENFVLSLMENDYGFVAVYESAGAVQGLMLGATFPPWFGDKHDRIASDIVLYVEPEARRGPAGFQLIAAFKHWATHTAPGVRQVRVGTSAGEAGQAANAIYEHLGFAATGKCFMLEVKEACHV